VPIYSRRQCRSICKQSDETIRQAHQQQLERLRYQAALAERQFNQVDPDNRLVAAELERPWEKALRELKQAELSQAQRQATDKATLLDRELKTALMTMGEKLPQIWSQDVLTQVH
jgi:hypothetical protein